jgi:hypothetical protein
MGLDSSAQSSLATILDVKYTEAWPAVAGVPQLTESSGIAVKSLNLQAVKHAVDRVLSNASITPRFVSGRRPAARIA